MIRKGKKQTGMDHYLSNVREHRVIDTSNSNGMLAGFWAHICSAVRFERPDDKKRLANGERVDTSLTGNRWNRLSDAWAERIEKIYGRDYATNKKGNLISALTKPAMTWGTFCSGLQILNGTGFFKRIRLELHLTSDMDESTQVISFDVFNKDADRKEDPYVAFAREHGVPTLKPGDTAYPMKHYIPEGFNNDNFCNIVLEYTGTTPLVTHSDTFHKLSIVDSTVFEASGMCSTEWIRIVGRDRG